MAEQNYEICFRHILGERAHRYRRVLLVLCLVVVAMFWFPGIDYSELEFFNLRPGNAVPNVKLFIVSVLWVVILYNGVMLFYHANDDYKNWRYDLLRERPADARWFAEIRMYYGREPSDEQTKRRYKRPGHWDRGKKGATWSLTLTRQKCPLSGVKRTSTKRV